MSLADLGAAVCVRQEAADDVRLGTELTLLFEDEARRVRMAASAREHGHPDAAQEVARDLLSLAGIKQKSKSPPHKPLNGGANGSTPISIPITKDVS